MPHILSSAMSSAGNAAHVPALLAPHLPFALRYAWLLAQWGLVPQALQYCAWVVQLHSSKGAPPGLHMCRALTDELQARLQVYAQVWHGACGVMCAMYFTHAHSLNKFNGTLYTC